jgi:hypothetical protein
MIAYQPALRPALPCIYGPLEYREQREQFVRINDLLCESRLDQLFISLAIKDQKIDPGKLAPHEAEHFARSCDLAMRTNIARTLTGLAHRKFCARLADSHLLQWFLQIGQIDQVRVFAKSTSERYANWVSAESMRVINNKFMALLTGAPADAAQPVPFGLEEAVECAEVFFDSTCLKTNIHFPTDWVLLRDVARTLMKATLCIRKAGLRERMPQSPEAFLSDMNKLCMAMSAQRRVKGGKKEVKRILRAMKKLDRRIAGHALAHREALETRRAETNLSEGQARVIVERIDLVLKQLPDAIKQAHERIIGGRQVPNEDKILSLYDEDINVIIRGKAGAETEFGNKLWLGESRHGLILDYQLLKDNPADTALVRPAVKRIVEGMKLPIQSAWGDRGLFSKSNADYLEKQGIKSGLCPRNPKELAEKLGQPGFGEGLKRRGGTEARIAIFQNVFMGRPTKGKSFEARELAVGWAVFTHNLWVVARMPKAGEKKARKPKRKAPAPGAQAQAQAA